VLRRSLSTSLNLTPPYNPSATHRNLIVLSRNAFGSGRNPSVTHRTPFVMNHNAFVLGHNSIASPVIACALCCIAVDGQEDAADFSRQLSARQGTILDNKVFF
jgi:hypothetical protein